MEEWEMKTSRVKSISVMTIVLSGFFLMSIATPQPALSKMSGSEIKLGFACGMTGACRDWCKNNKVAFDLAMEEINKAGGIGGLPVKVIVADTATNPSEAANMIRKLAADDKVLAIQGPFLSNEVEVAFPVANEMKIATISQASSKPGLGAKNRPYGFRNCPDEAVAAKPAIKKFVEKYKIKNVVFIHDIKDAVSKSLGTVVFPPLFKNEGVTIVNEGNYITFQTGDFDMRAQVTKMNGYKFDGIVIGSLYTEAATFAKEARRQGITQPIFGGATIVNEYLIKQAGKSAEGIMAPSTFWPQMPGKTQTFVKAFLEKSKGDLPTIQDAHSYDNVYLLKHIIETTGVTNKAEDLATDRERIMKGLTATKAFPGIEGSVGFNDEGDGVVQVYVIEVSDGKWVQVQ
jgi:branched-chain amino acid transport system substrate-binding protein